MLPFNKEGSIAPSGARAVMWAQLITYISIALVTAGGLSYVNQTNPEALTDLMVHVDVFGITPQASQEKERQYQIRMLTIPYEKKKVLLERTVFLGATRQMVVLALGEPKEAQKITEHEKRPDGKIINERWVYYFKDDPRPTVLEFEKDSLASAFKGSNLDYIQPQQQQKAQN